MSNLRFAMIGAGFWSTYQLAAWQELSGAICVAVCDPLQARAQQLATQFDVPAVYDDVRTLLRSESLDFVDIVTSVESHHEIASAAIAEGVAVICQKPMTPTLEQSRLMVQESIAAGVPLLIHENWRWQAPLRELKKVIASGTLGPLVRARIDYANSFPVFDNQPFLKQLDRFILTDIGTHILDVARFLFGEADQLYCQTRQMRSDIKGEDVATVMLHMRDGLTVTCNMSYASRWQYDRFPQTMVDVEGTAGGASLGEDFRINVFDDRGVQTHDATPPRYEWADPDYDLIHSSIVDCHRNLLGALRAESPAETTGEDNLHTLELVFGAYDSAEQNTVKHLDNDQTG